VRQGRPCSAWTGFEVTATEVVDGECQLTVQTTATVVACMGCGVPAEPALPMWVEHQIIDLVLGPTRLIELPGLLDHPFDHPDDRTGSFLIRRDRRGTRREQGRSVWSRPVRR
jgi:hypothetical protein